MKKTLEEVNDYESGNDNHFSSDGRSKKKKTALTDDIDSIRNGIFLEGLQKYLNNESVAASTKPQVSAKDVIEANPASRLKEQTAGMFSNVRHNKLIQTSRGDREEPRTVPLFVPEYRNFNGNSRSRVFSDETSESSLSFEEKIDVGISANVVQHPATQSYAAPSTSQNRNYENRADAAAAPANAVPVVQAVEMVNETLPNGKKIQVSKDGKFMNVEIDQDLYDFLWASIAIPNIEATEKLFDNGDIMEIIQETNQESIGRLGVVSQARVPEPQTRFKDEDSRWKVFKRTLLESIKVDIDMYEKSGFVDILQYLVERLTGEFNITLSSSGIDNLLFAHIPNKFIEARFRFYAREVEKIEVNNKSLMDRINAVKRMLLIDFPLRMIRSPTDRITMESFRRGNSQFILEDRTAKSVITSIQRDVLEMHKSVLRNNISEFVFSFPTFKFAKLVAGALNQDNVTTYLQVQLHTWLYNYVFSFLEYKTQPVATAQGPNAGLQLRRPAEQVLVIFPSALPWWSWSNNNENLDYKKDRIMEFIRETRKEHKIDEIIKLEDTSPMTHIDQLLSAKLVVAKNRAWELVRVMFMDSKLNGKMPSMRPKQSDPLTGLPNLNYILMNHKEPLNCLNEFAVLTSVFLMIHKDLVDEVRTKVKLDQTKDQLLFAERAMRVKLNLLGFEV